MWEPPKVVSRPAGGLRGAVSAPAGYGAVPRSKKYVSKYFHRFFITINSMILYFKHIIRIDDFPLNGHPPSIYYMLDNMTHPLYLIYDFTFLVTVLVTRKHKTSGNSITMKLHHSLRTLEQHHIVKIGGAANYCGTQTLNACTK